MIKMYLTISIFLMVMSYQKKLNFVEIFDKNKALKLFPDKFYF